MSGSERTKILFICFGNMIRSQMAEGFGRSYGDAFLDVYSAGLHPTGVVSAEAIQVMREKGIDISGHHSKGIDDVPIEEMDIVVSLTGHAAADICPPSFTGSTVDWKIDDPVGQHFERFRTARDEIEARVRELVETIWKTGGPPQTG
ncbi:MAG: arsenate reductase ArsC [Candidatus Krumholzibacteria bacterium]|nr:arsenate reductase ArsC [Candidatus Krumholzibacteria bacterium]